MTYIIDDSSIATCRWTSRVDRKSKYIVMFTSSEPQHLSNDDLGTFMAKGIKTKFIRCNSIEDIYMQIGFLLGQAYASGLQIVLVSDSMEYDSYIREWQQLGLNVTRESSI